MGFIAILNREGNKNDRRWHADNRWVVYLVACSDQTLYCGITNHLEKRIVAHNQGKGAKYTRSRKPVKLMENSAEMTKSEALKLEHLIKKTPAGQKRLRLQMTRTR